MSLTISELAKAAAVGVETVRYYQRRGLMPEPPRPAGPGSTGGIRRYDQDDTRRLRFIRSAQAAGFTLKEIGELLAMDANDDRAQVRQLAEARIAALDDRIEELGRVRRSLARLTELCSSAADGPCPILTAFEFRYGPSCSG